MRFWNPGAERIFGYASKDAVGQSLDIIIPERLRKHHADGFRRVMEGRLSARHGRRRKPIWTWRYFSGSRIKKDGTGISVEFTIVPLTDKSGRLTGVAAIMRDVTKKFEAARALKRKLAEATKTVV